MFGAKYAEVRVASGALANLYVFMATCKPGDTIIAPPADIGGHVTHHGAGAAGLYGLKTVPAPVLADGYTVDVAALDRLAWREVRLKLDHRRRQPQPVRAPGGGDARGGRRGGRQAAVRRRASVRHGGQRHLGANLLAQGARVMIR